ncbi:MAG: 2-amino-4-hydroxy-6-hydroxymethyldihydropteridine diphosphokinase [Candidatus Dormibacteraeota bacterium]|nr:2-amino-4-hydroxy-6-hydroxymethyldihydropteridine diphosphokinase [Candidatus Dormibacteraeota bacterium]
MSSTDVAWVAIGSNLGRRGLALARLREALTADGVRIERVSSEILTRPFGVAAQPDFHNQLLVLRSPVPWTPQHWLDHAKGAEAAAGRRQTYHWGPRVADADIILLGVHGEIRVDEPGLTVPHPGLHERPYLRRLLDELGAKEAEHPSQRR